MYLLHRTARLPRINEKNEILCTYCLLYKLDKAFFPSNLKKKHYKCINCISIERQKSKKDVRSLVHNFFAHQKSSSKITYTKKELHAWLLKQPKFLSLFSEWKIVNFDKKYTPALVRIDATKPFSFDNIFITTSSAARNISKRKSKPVVQLDKNDREISRFPNAHIAAKILNYKWYSNIHEVCRGTKKTAVGFKWKYL